MKNFKGINSYLVVLSVAFTFFFLGIAITLAWNYMTEKKSTEAILENAESFYGVYEAIINSDFNSGEGYAAQKALEDSIRLYLKSDNMSVGQMEIYFEELANMNKELAKAFLREAEKSLKGGDCEYAKHFAGLAREYGEKPGSAIPDWLKEFEIFINNPANCK